MSSIRKRSLGFSLLEILVAFSILALSLGVLMQIFSGSLRNAELSRDQAQATTLAQSLLASLGVESLLSAGETSGVVDDKFRWVARVGPAALEARPGETDAISTPQSLQLWDVVVRVAWGGGGRVPERAVTLRTLRVQPAGATP